MRFWHKLIGFMVAFIAFSQFMLFSSASDENVLGFGSKRRGLTPNMPLAKNGDYENWNIATLGFLDRLELTLEQGFNPFSDFNEFDYEAIRTINIGGGIPSFRFGTFGLGLGVIEDDTNTSSLIYPYLAYSRHFMDRISLGVAYSIEIPQGKIAIVDNTKYIKQNSLEQFGVILKLFKHVRMGFNIENHDYLDNIESIRPEKIKADLFYGEAKLDYENEKYEEAEQKFKKCLEIDPDHDDSKSLLINIYKDILSKVRSSYTKALVDPSGNILKDIKPKLSLIAETEYADLKDIACAYIYLGAIQVVFEKDDDAGKDMFVKALNTYPKSELTNDLDDPDIKKVFDEAKREFFLKPEINR